MTNTLKTPWVRFIGCGLGRWLGAQKGLLCKLESLRSESLAKASSFRFIESSYLEAVRQVTATEENTQCAALASTCAHKRTYAGTLADSCVCSTSTNTCTRWGQWGRKRQRQSVKRYFWPMKKTIFTLAPEYCRRNPKKGSKSQQFYDRVLQLVCTEPVLHTEEGRTGEIAVPPPGLEHQLDSRHPQGAVLCLHVSTLMTQHVNIHTTHKRVWFKKKKLNPGTLRNESFWTRHGFWIHSGCGYLHKINPTELPARMWKVPSETPTSLSVLV